MEILFLILFSLLPVQFSLSIGRASDNELMPHNRIGVKLPANNDVLQMFADEEGAIDDIGASENKKFEASESVLDSLMDIRKDAESVLDSLMDTRKDVSDSIISDELPITDTVGTKQRDEEVSAEEPLVEVAGDELDDLSLNPIQAWLRDKGLDPQNYGAMAAEGYDSLDLLLDMDAEDVDEMVDACHLKPGFGLKLKHALEVRKKQVLLQIRESSNSRPSTEVPFADSSQAVIKQCTYADVGLLEMSEEEREKTFFDAKGIMTCVKSKAEVVIKESMGVAFAQVIEVLDLIVSGLIDGAQVELPQCILGNLGPQFEQKLRQVATGVNQARARGRAARGNGAANT